MTYQGMQFTSKLVQKIMEEYKIKHRKSIPCHPQENGQVESTNKVIQAILTNTVHLHRRDWEKIFQKIYGHIIPHGETK